MTSIKGLAATGEKVSMTQNLTKGKSSEGSGIKTD